MNGKRLGIVWLMLLYAVILTGCSHNKDSKNSMEKTDIDGNGVADYAIFHNPEEEDKASFIEIYFNEEKIYEHETKHWIAGVNPMEYTDLDGDGEKEIFITFNPMVNSMPLAGWFVLKEEESGWRTMEMPKGTEDMEEVFPVTVTLGSGKFDFIITCEGYEEQIQFDAACNYPNAAVWGEDTALSVYEAAHFTQGNEVAWTSLWGVWEIRSGKIGEQECLIATQGLQGVGGKFDMLGTLDIYYHYDSNGKIKILDVSFKQDTALKDVKEDYISDLWERKEGESEGNVLEFVTGLQVVFPKEWEDKVVMYTEPAVQNYGGGIDVCEKRNDEAGAGGMLFILEYYKYDEDAIGPYEIFQSDKVLGVYQNGEDRYALVFTKPRDMQYAEGDEEMRKAYEEFCALTDKVQVITENMEGFTECGLYDLDWIVLSGYEQPKDVKMISYHNKNYELEYPARWEVKEERGEDGSRISFFEETSELVFWIEQGEAWRVDLNRSAKDYQKILEESYQEAEVLELSKVKVNGHDAQKLIFSYVSNGRKKAVTRYTVVAGYAFYEMNYADSPEMMSGSNLGEAVVDSVCFDYSNRS